jgi:hypothetical protein
VKASETYDIASTPDAREAEFHTDDLTPTTVGHRRRTLTNDGLAPTTV